MRGVGFRRFKHELLRFGVTLVVGASLTVSVLVFVFAFAWFVGVLLGVKIN